MYMRRSGRALGAKDPQDRSAPTRAARSFLKEHVTKPRQLAAWDTFPDSELSGLARRSTLFAGLARKPRMYMRGSRCTNDEKGFRDRAAPTRAARSFSERARNKTQAACCVGSVPRQQASGAFETFHPVRKPRQEAPHIDAGPKRAIDENCPRSSRADPPGSIFF